MKPQVEFGLLLNGMLCSLRIASIRTSSLLFYLGQSGKRKSFDLHTPLLSDKHYCLINGWIKKNWIKDSKLKETEAGIALYRDRWHHVDSDCASVFAVTLEIGQQ